MSKNYLVSIFAFLIILLFTLSLVKADGGMIVRPIILKSIAETHQIATIRLDSDQKTAEISLFISLTDLSSESHDIKFFIPFKDKPLSFNIVDTTLNDFSKTEGIDEIDQKIAEQERLKSEIKDHYLTSLIGPGLLISPAPLAYFYISGSFMGGGLGPSEILQFGTSRVEIYQITSEADLNSLIQEVGLPENIASRYREYGNMYIYLVNMKSSPVITTATNLQTNCPETYKKVIDYIREHKEITTYRWEPVPREAYIFIAECPQAEDDIINLFRGIFTPTEREIKGAKLTWKLSLTQKPEGYYVWYPLGTGKLWDYPIDMIKIYTFPGNFKNIKLSHSSTKLSLSEDVHIVKLENANPSNDLEIYASTELSLVDKISSSFSRSIKGFAFSLLTVANSWVIYPIVLLTFVASWIVGFKLFLVYVLKKDLKFPSLIKESLLSFGVFIGSSWIGTILTGILVIPLIFVGAWILAIPLLPIGALGLFAFYNKSKYKTTWKQGFVFSLLLLVKCLLVFGVLFGIGYLLILGLSAIVF